MNHKGKPVPIFVLNLSDYSPPPAVLRIKCLERRPVRLLNHSILWKIHQIYLVSQGDYYNPSVPSWCTYCNKRGFAALQIQKS